MAWDLFGESDAASALALAEEATSLAQELVRISVR